MSGAGRKDDEMCNHATQTVIAENDRLEICRCTWACQKVLVYEKDGAMRRECPLCEARRLLHQASAIIDQIPELGSPNYDDVISDLSNDISNALSTFQCMCDDEPKV